MPVFFLIICNYFFFQVIQVDKTAFYNVLKGNSPKEIDITIDKIQKEKPDCLINAYLGALYMKKSSFVRKPVEKLKIFNQGKLLLEESITANPANTEMRLLRLIIQENSPKHLKYNGQIMEDKAVIIRNYRKTDTELKGIIKDYAKASLILKPEDFVP